ncbi:MAG: hypothetical protein R6U46_08890 [Marinilabilia sp.]
MTLKIQTYDGTIDRGDWGAFVQAHPDGSIFQMPWMYEVYEKTRHQKPVAFFAFENQQLVGLVVAVNFWNSFFPLSVFTRRQIVLGGPLVLNNDIGVLLALVETLVQHTETEAIYTEIRNLRLGLSYKPVYEEAGFYYESHLRVGVDMKRKTGEMWASLSPDRQKNIKRLKKVDQSVRELSTKEEVMGAWKIFRCTIGEQGRPVPHHTLFKAICNSDDLRTQVKFRGFFPGDHMKAAAMVMMLKSRAFIWYEGSCLPPDQEWMYDGFLWSIISELQDEGYQYIDMGDGGRPGKDQLTRQYKKSYGGMIRETGRYTYVHNWFLWHVGRTFFYWYKKVRIFVFTHFCRQ